MSIIGKLIIGILRVAGLIAAPFTFGARIVVSIVGAGIDGAEGMVMSGFKVVEIILEKLGLKEVQAVIEDDREACSELQKQTPWRTSSLAQQSSLNRCMMTRFCSEN